ncbi:MAG: DUF6236 family protein [Bryobacteraceae bacterium]|nr:DUF6236 family protein [Bryobacteraceae bacterium]
MAFTKALYYPRIQVPNEGWLKTAMLYWESVQTIVPASMPEPYHGTSRVLFDAGVLSPLHVHPHMEIVERLASKVLDYFGSTEADGVLIEAGLRQSDLIHPEKLPELRELVSMHPEKFPYELQHQLQRMFLGREGEWVRVNRPFARFYMTMLATELAESHGIALLTDLPASDRLAVNVRLDSKLGIPNIRFGDPHWHRYGRDWLHERLVPGSLAPALLADLTLQKIAINPDTSVDDLLRFREDHKDQLGRFRTKMAELTKSINGELTIEALQQGVADIYANEVKPTISEIKDCLSASNIKWVLENFLKTSMLSVPAALQGFGLSIPHALLAGAGISLTVSAVLYNLQRREDLRKNPYSYLMEAEAHFRQ